MEKRSLTIWAIAAVIFAVVGGTARAAEYTHIWIDQGTGINHPDTNGTPDEPFKSITYALARADYLAWPEPWHVHIGPGVYDANSAKPAPEREIFPIELRQDMIFESTDPNDPGSYVIDGRHLVEGFASLLYGNDLTGVEICGLTFCNMDHSTGNGGAIELESCSGLIQNCIIRDCSAQRGGGLWLSPRAGAAVPFDFISCSFIGNTANQRGGGVYISDDLTGNITDCTFTGNTGNGDGGGFGIDGSLTGDIIGCEFTENVGHIGGGGFYVRRTVIGSISGSSFTDNSVIYDGGGFYCGTFAGNISDCKFTSNAATGSLWRGYGGGFYCGTFAGNIHDCEFTENVARLNGAGFHVNSNLTGDIWDCSFDENAAPNGGGFRISGNLTGNISRCEFDNGDSMASDLAVQINGSFDGIMEVCRFYDFGKNAVRLLNSSGTPATIRSCLFVAPVTLGAVSGWAIRTKQKTIISNNTMVGSGLVTDLWPSAIYIEFGTQAENGEILNNIIVDTAIGICVDAGVDMPITYNQFYNVAEIVCQGEQCLGNDIWWLEWNLSNFRDNDYDDPLFFAYDSVYHIQETSPCVDAGDPNYEAEPNETDIDGQPRIDIDTVDIGADEYYAYILTADIYHNGIVNFLDYAVLVSYWGQNEPLADIAPPGGDGVVDFLDLGILVDEWLLTEPWY